MSRPPRARPKGNPLVAAAATLALLAALYWLNEGNRPNRAGRTDAPTSRDSPATTAKSRGFDRLDGCVLVPARNNDGDSFVLRHGGETHEMRLYFADCPEKYRHQFNGERLNEQGAYFGGLSEKETLRLGGEARDFTLDLLHGGAFTVYTKWEKVYDSGRFYALVLVRDARGGETSLDELLVARGLARIHTKGIDLPDGTSWRARKSQLAEVERKARTAKLGGWAR